ncbi:glycoside hydrolase family 53 protein [Desertivirga xinjiangensis]|uniref:glycoside hydrolase family 53 protein n=1 Tax=Desertivirga xinjiangensis TaxID=539206 RepID=UPI00210D3927|nr:glycosyl hydrolase 53 family protein [Pedobacter xinjiangensis]
MIKSIKQFLPALLILIVLVIACKKTSGTNAGEEPDTTDPVDQGTALAKGADISWLTEMEAAGIKFYNNAGTQQDLLQILKDKGMNTIRLRVWVNPSDGWCNKADVLAKAIRAKNMGFRIMIDFHYSDSWADPGKQTKPAAWVAQAIAGLKTSVYDHTVDVLTLLKNNNISPEWVQVGNETNNGMLWEEGKASFNMKNFADLINSGYSGVKSVYPGAKVIVHISNGYDNSLFRWMFDGLKNNGAQWDVIGMSLYPATNEWQSKNNQCLSNMQDMVARYGKEVMVVEVGMPAADATEAKSFIADLITKVKSIPNNKGLGVLYWEPQSYNSWKGYKLGAFTDNGRPGVALDAFMN